MQARLDPYGTDLGPKFAKYLISANKAVADSTLPAATQELVKIRASQINGCGDASTCTPRRPRARERHRYG